MLFTYENQLFNYEDTRGDPGKAQSRRQNQRHRGQDEIITEHAGYPSGHLERGASRCSNSKPAGQPRTSAEIHFHRSPKVQYRYRMGGSGPSIVFSADPPMTLEIYDELMAVFSPLLSRDHRRVAGHGVFCRAAQLFLRLQGNQR
jgi:hypothetical protein